MDDKVHWQSWMDGVRGRFGEDFDGQHGLADVTIEPNDDEFIVLYWPTEISHTNWEDIYHYIGRYPTMEKAMQVCNELFEG